MQSPQQRIYYQETFAAMHNANGKTQLRLCNTCHQSLRNEQKKGHAALSAEVTDVHANPNPTPRPAPNPNHNPNPNPNPNQVKKFTRELVGGERDKLVLSQMEECHVPQRSLEHGDAPVLYPYPYPTPTPTPTPDTSPNPNPSPGAHLFFYGW